MTRRQTVTSGTPWEPIVGYARAVRLGNAVYVSGTTATDDRGAVVGRGDPYAQTRQALRNIERALAAAGATMADDDGRRCAHPHLRREHRPVARDRSGP